MEPAREFETFHDFCKSNELNYDELLEYFNNDADPNLQDDNGSTPFHEMCINPNVTADMVNLMLTHGANPNLRDEYDLTPILIVGYNEDIFDTELYDIIKLLLQHGATEVNINENYNLFNFYKDSPEIIKLLLDYDVDPNEANNRGDTALHLILHGHDVNFDIIKILLEHGANPNIVNNKGENVLNYYLDSYEFDPEIEIIKILLEHGVDTDNEYNDPLFIYVNRRGRNFDIIKLLLSYGADPNKSFSEIMKDEITPNIKLVKLFLKYGADPNFENQRHETPFTLFLAFHNNYDITKLLLEGYGPNKDYNKADVNSVTEDNVSILHFTSHLDDDVLELLLGGTNPDEVQYKADINAVDIDNLTPLFYQVMEDNVDVDRIEFLLKHKADPNIKQKFYEETVLHKSSENKEIEVVNLLLQYQADVNVKNRFGRTPLHLAAEQGGVEEVEALLSYGADVNYLDIKDNTPLHLATDEGEIEVVKLLLDNNADSNIQNVYGNTALHLACKYGLEELRNNFLVEEKEVDENENIGLQLIKMLLENGADPGIENNEGELCNLFNKECENLMYTHTGELVDEIDEMLDGSRVISSTIGKCLYGDMTQFKL